MPCGGSLALRNRDRVWRQAKNTDDYYHWYFDNDGTPIARLRVKGLKGRAPSGTQMNPDLSVLWAEHLAAHGFDDEYVRKHDENYPLIFEATVGDIRKIRTETGGRLYVAYTPTDDEPLGCAHASVLDLGLPKEQKEAARTSLSELFRHRSGTLTIEPPEGS